MVTLYVLERPGSLADMHASYQRGLVNQIKQGVLAEKLGFDYLWPVEHHFQPEGAEFSPNPMLMEMAIAAQTSRIRLGQYANILTWWHPLRIAEQGAMLDIVSGGRVEFGVGRGYQPRETEVLGRNFGATIQDQERNRSSFEEALEIVLKAWTEASFSHHGENFSIPPRYTKWHHPMTIDLFSQPGFEHNLDPCSSSMLGARTSSDLCDEGPQVVVKDRWFLKLAEMPDVLVEYLITGSTGSYGFYDGHFSADAPAVL